MEECRIPGRKGVNEEEKIWKTSLLLSATDLRTPMIEVALQSYDVICSYRMDHPKKERSTLNMSQYNLDRIFQPRRVAVVGASEKARSIGNALMTNLLEGGYKGMLLPVTPKYDTQREVKRHTSIPTTGQIGQQNADSNTASHRRPAHFSFRDGRPRSPNAAKARREGKGWRKARSIGLHA